MQTRDEWNERMGWAKKGAPTTGSKTKGIGWTKKPKCNKCGEDDISLLKKNKTRAWGVCNICRKCSYKYYEKPIRSGSKWQQYNHEQKVKAGYTVVEGHGWFRNGDTLYYREVHNNTDPLSFIDGTILKRNRDGKLFEVYNKPMLVEVDND